ncbi:MAG: XTP/dITP diphosphatase [Candidatus Altiarchaeales archaeon]|nr:XTP/dITP diphosphatase [Candidatus Altiarchaeales archaeon]
MKIFFATSNKHKVEESNEIARALDLYFEQINSPYPEIRSEDVSEVAEAGAQYVYNRVGKPVVVEDSGLYVDALSGFPGAYSSMVLSKIGLKGILSLMLGESQRSAHFKSSIAYADGHGVKVFSGEVQGEITPRILGDKGFGYDPIFRPLGWDKTFAQDPVKKNQVSHRKKAVKTLSTHLLSKRG